MEQYIAEESARHAVQPFLALLNHPGRLLISRNDLDRDTAAGTWRKEWKHWGGRGTSELCTASAELDIAFERSAEEVGY